MHGLHCMCDCVCLCVSVCVWDDLLCIACTHIPIYMLTLLLKWPLISWRFLWPDSGVGSYSLSLSSSSLPSPVEWHYDPNCPITFFPPMKSPHAHFLQINISAWLHIAFTLQVAYTHLHSMLSIADPNPCSNPLNSNDQQGIMSCNCLITGQQLRRTALPWFSLTMNQKKSPFLVYIFKFNV